jgi:tetratricopeptide (TPR) repeat protein
VLRSRTVLAWLVPVLLVVVAAPACRGGDPAARGSGGPAAAAAPAAGEPGAAATSPAAAAGVPFIAVDASSASPTDRAIAGAQARLRADPTNPDALADLAGAYLQKAREVADPSLYSKTRGILALLHHSIPRDVRYLLLAGTLDLAQHRFTDALKVGQRAVNADPSSSAAYGVVVDASNELGRYDAALAATQKMLDLRPDLPALSRASYARELHGDVAGAITLMMQAVSAGGTQGGENVAYVQVQLGHLLLTSGDVAGAEGQYEAALQSFPGFAAARAGQARVFVAEGHPAEAARLLAQVVQVQPLAEYVIAEGDDWAAAGQPAAAAQAYQLVGAIEQLYKANGVNVDLELALFDADHVPGAAALARARAGFRVRPSYLGHEVVAWNLYRAGRLAEARREMASALAVGSDDPLLRFQASVVADAVGDDGAARQNLAIVLGGNPRFSSLYQAQEAALATRVGLVVPPPAPLPAPVGG